MKLLNWFQDSLKCCLHCGSLQAKDSQFCLRCEYDLWKMHPWLTDFVLHENLIRGKALFSWYPDQDRKVSKLMMALKGGELVSAFQFYAETFASRLPQDAIPENAILAPCPNNSKRQHSQRWARALSEVLQIPWVEALQKEALEYQQKSKSKQDRQEILMTSTVDFSGKYVIFIDDIVTTGATAVSARKALHSSHGFEVWCMAYRRQLAASLEL